MSMSATVDRPILPEQAYPLSQRRAHAEQHILAMHSIGELETPKSAEVARTYGIPDFTEELKAMKAKFRNELSFSGGDA
jgi:hypothetical protein